MSTSSNTSANNSTNEIYYDNDGTSEMWQPLLSQFGFGITGTCAIFGNSLVLISVYRCQQLRTRTNAVVTSLAVSDLLLGAIVIPFFMTAWYRELPFPYFHVCLLFDLGLQHVSVMHVWLIAAERYISVLHPFQRESLVTARTLTASLTIVWILGMIKSAINVYFIYKFGERSYTTTLYSAVRSVCLFFLPSIFVLIMYGRIWSVALSQGKKIRCMTQTTENGNKTVLTSMKEQKATLRLGVVVAVFVTCWSPFFAYPLIELACKSCWTYQTFTVTVWLSYANSAINPVIYSVCGREFRKCMLRVLSSGRAGTSDA